MPGVETVRKTGAVKTVERFQALGPMIGERLSTAAVNLEARTAGIGGAYFETRAEDDAVDLVFDSVNTRPFSVIRSTPRPLV